MSEPTKQRDGDQPLPTAGRECVQDALIAEIQARKELGIQRYGSALMTHNGRDSLRDAREEAVDLAVYLMQVELEDRDAKADLAAQRPFIDRLLAAQGRMLEHWADASAEPTMVCRNAMWAELHAAAHALEDHLTTADFRHTRVRHNPPTCADGPS